MFPLPLGRKRAGQLFALHLIAVHTGLNPLVGLPLAVGFFQTSATLDQVGVFTNDLRDAALSLM